MASKRQDYNTHLLVMCVLSCFIVTSASHIVHNKTTGYTLSAFQQALEKYEGFGSIVKMENANENRYHLYQVIIPHSATVMFVMVASLLKRRILSETVRKQMYENKVWQPYRFMLLHLPCYTSLMFLVTLTCITLFLMDVTLMMWSIVTFGNESKNSPKTTKKSNSKPKKSPESTPNVRPRRSLSKRLFNEDDQGEGITPPPKKGKNDSNAGLVCEIWMQTGRDARLATKHSMMSNARRALQNAARFSKHATFDEFNVSLENDSYICNGCYQDAIENCDAEPHIAPRWHKKKFPERYKCTEQHHCALCHQDWIDRTVESPCKSRQDVVKAGTWKKKQSVQFWNQVLSSPPYAYKPTLKDSSTLCRMHFMKLQTMYMSRECFICKDKTDGKWTLYDMLSKQVKSKIAHNLKVNTESLDGKQNWVCHCCEAAETCLHLNPEISELQSDQVITSTESKPESSAANLKLLLERDCQEKSDNTKDAASITLDAIQHITKVGYIWKKDITKSFKQMMKKKDKAPNELVKAINNFEYYLTTLFAKATDYSSVKLPDGIVFYENSKHTEYSVSQITVLVHENSYYKQKIENFQRKSILYSDIQKMFDDQTKLFSDNASKLDYRNLMDESGNLLGKYVHKPLFDFFVRVLKISGYEYQKGGSTIPSDKAERKKMSQYLRLLMGTGVLCHLKNRNALIMQNIISLYMYAYGLRDSGFNVLNRFGVSCSIRHIRKMAKVWASKRKCIDEVNTKCLWKVTFDNLNFSRKFAKTNILGGEKSGRMLDLLTGQISHQSSEPNSPFQIGEPRQNLPNTVNDLRTDNTELEKSTWKTFLNNISICQKNRNRISSDDQTSILIEDLEDVMPDYTPQTKDNIVYTTVKEAKSSSINDIADYLYDVKKDLHIGEDQHPQKVVVCGDQQTYSLLKNLIKKYPDTFSWAIPMVGDWHYIKLAGETIKSILWDGGFHHLGMKCGHLKDITSWRDIHNMILALHESLISSLLDIHPEDDFDLATYVEENLGTDQNINVDEIARFWISILHYINAYVGLYFAIRSGNFALRNACLPKLAELFFAYNHTNYQTLICEHLLDLRKMPENLKQQFQNGQWVMSISGTKFHNVALDEGHEGVINKRLKRLTTRASEYRTVTLSDFMAYLDKFIANLNGKIFEKKKKTSRSKTTLKYLKKVKPFVKTVDIFSEKNRPLCNIFAGEGKKELDDATKQDLLSIQREGKSRMNIFIDAKYVQIPPQKPPRQRKLSTFSPKSSTQFREKQKTNKVTHLLKRAYAELQKAGHYIEKTVAFPLALCTEEGQLRDRHKAKILKQLELKPEFSSMFKSYVPFDITTCEIIMDFLKFMHEPTPPNILTHYDLALYYWKNVIMKKGFNRGISIVTVVIDKAQFLPPIRQMIHSERRNKGKKNDLKIPQEIRDETHALHGINHGEALKNQTYKMDLIQYLQNKFIYFAQHLHNTNGTLTVGSNRKLVIDCINDMPVSISDGKVTLQHERSNTKGEADNAIFVHAMKSVCNNILIVASDTDITMYAIAVLEAYQLEHQGRLSKHIVIEKEDNNYICTNTALDNFSSSEHVHHAQHSHFIGHSVLAIYILAGSDYLSTVFGITCDTMLMTFFRYIDHVSPPNDPLIISDQTKFQKVNHVAFLRLLCCIYLEKYKRLTSHLASNPVQLYELFRSSSYNMNSELSSLLEWLDYSSSDLKQKSIKISTSAEWTTFTRRVCFFMNHGAKNLYSLILPSDSSIKLHCQRGSFVIKLAVDYTNKLPNLHEKFEDYGWIIYADMVTIVWDENFKEDEKNLSKKRQLPISSCSCTTGCHMEKKGCKNCGKACRPCNAKCACKGQCSNPHNNGGSCNICRADESEKPDTNDEGMALEEVDEDEEADVNQLTMFDDLDTYFNQESQNFIAIPPANANTESDSESSGDEYISSDSELDI